MNDLIWRKNTFKVCSMANIHTSVRIFGWEMRISPIQRFPDLENYMSICCGGVYVLISNLIIKVFSYPINKQSKTGTTCVICMYTISFSISSHAFSMWNWFEESTLAKFAYIVSELFSYQMRRHTIVQV